LDIILLFKTLDKLPKETSLINGKEPLFLQETSADSLILSLFGNREVGNAEMGADQSILVRTVQQQEALLNILPNALILTITEAKGLEFEDCLVYNFFSDSECSSWRVITGLSSDEGTRKFDAKRDHLLSTELKALCIVFLYPNSTQMLQSLGPSKIFGSLMIRPRGNRS
jgi:hypothetical protein